MVEGRVLDRAIVQLSEHLFDCLVVRAGGWYRLNATSGGDLKGWRRGRSE